MADISTIVDLVYPTVSGVSIPTNAQIWIVFDREIDETSLDGNFFLTGPDQDTWSGPDLGLYTDYESIGSEDEILQSPDFHGILQGTITTERIRTDSYSSYTGYDYTGNGFSYRTKAIFTPTNRLTADTEYTVYLSGDEDTTDSLNTGIRTRTVYDTVKGSNLGTGTALFTGGYTGTATNQYNVAITTAGEPNTAKFTYYLDSDPSLVFGPYYTKQGGVVLSDGVSITFGEGTYVVGDTFSVVVIAPTTFTGNLLWPFETGTGSILEVPSTTSTLITGAPSASSSTSTSTDTFSVLATYPGHRATNLDVVDTDFDIEVLFSDSIDDTTITSDTVIVATEPVNGDVSSIAYSGVLPTTLSVSGDELTITVASGLMFSNNVVIVTLDAQIASTSGVELDSDNEFYFTTTYNPLYSSVRKVRLDYGASLANVPDDTINLAIFEASLEADVSLLSTSATNANYYTFARRQWVTCRAAEVLVSNALGSNSGLKSKRLADLEVQYDPKASSGDLDRALGCLAKWTPVIQAGGYSVQTPTFFVKGELDPDRPTVGRLWKDTDIYTRKTPAANAKSLDETKSRRYKSGYYSRWGK